MPPRSDAWANAVRLGVSFIALSGGFFGMYAAQQSEFMQDFRDQHRVRVRHVLRPLEELIRLCTEIRLR